MFNYDKAISEIQIYAVNTYKQQRLDFHREKFFPHFYQQKLDNIIFSFVGIESDVSKDLSIKHDVMDSKTKNFPYQFTFFSQKTFILDFQVINDKFDERLATASIYLMNHTHLKQLDLELKLRYEEDKLYWYLANSTTTFSEQMIKNHILSTLQLSIEQEHILISNSN